MIYPLIYLSNAFFRPPVGSSFRKQALWVLSFLAEIGKEIRNKVWKIANGSWGNVMEGEPLFTYNEQTVAPVQKFKFCLSNHQVSPRPHGFPIFSSVSTYSIHTSCYRRLTAAKCFQSARRIAYKVCMFVSVLRKSIHFLVQTCTKSVGIMLAYARAEYGPRFTVSSSIRNTIAFVKMPAWSASGFQTAVVLPYAALWLSHDLKFSFPFRAKTDRFIFSRSSEAVRLSAVPLLI